MVRVAVELTRQADLPALERGLAKLYQVGGWVWVDGWVRVDGWVLCRPASLTPLLPLPHQSDPAVEVSVTETGEHVISALGELHLEQCIKVGPQHNVS
jgi:translation elongation factor EF-G